MAVPAYFNEYLHAFRLLVRVEMHNLAGADGYRIDTYHYGPTGTSTE